MRKLHVQLVLIVCVQQLVFNNQAANAQSAWPSFRGPDRTAVAPDTGLLDRWPAAGPPLLWKTEGAGKGYAGVAVADGKLFTLGDDISKSDTDEYLVCFQQSDGSQLWKYRTGQRFKLRQYNWRHSRCTPTVDGDRVYVITPDGVLHCVTTATGAKVFVVDLKKSFQGKKADIWGYSESILIDGDQLICTPGGPENTMVALNKTTGQKIWSTAVAGDVGAGHASCVISQIGSQKIYVTTTGSGAMGVRATDGKLMWTYGIDRTTAVAPTPIVRDDLVFFTAGYKRGGALLRQTATGNGQVDIQEIYPLNPKLSNKHGGVVLVGDYLYGDTDDKGTPFCADLMTGELQWRSRGSGRSSASFAAADGHLYIYYSNGVMTLVNAQPNQFEEVGVFKVPGDDKVPSWAHPVIVDKKLFLRRGTNILCYQLAQ